MTAVNKSIAGLRAISVHLQEQSHWLPVREGGSKERISRGCRGHSKLISSKSRMLEHATLLDKFYGGVVTMVDSRVARPAPQSGLSSAESEARPMESHLFILK